jgi:D-xylose transport system permease protein
MTDLVEEQPVQKASDLDPRLLVDEAGVRGYLTAFRRRVSGGELGSLPVIIGLVVIWLVFYSRQHAFLGAENLSNLVLQMVATGLLSVGIVMVLLLGEVDLSVGSVSGVTAALFATQAVNSGRNQVLAVLMAVTLGAVIGAVHGFFFTRFGVPSFVVTLAGLLGWQGLQLKVLGTTGSVNVTDGFVNSITSAFYPASTGWLLAVVAVALYLVAQLVEVRARRRADLRPRPMIEVIGRTVVLSVILAVAVSVLNRYRGVPFALVLFLVIVVLFDLLIRRTRYGRHVLAVGGNAEAARRAGISVNGIRMSVFIIAGVMAAVGGIVNASYLQSVDQSTGGSNTLLYAIAAAVIGGTSLFGGRGSAYSALLGVLVITSITNGMALLTLPSSTQFMVTGAVLLASVTLDAVSRRSQRATGRR